VYLPTYYSFYLGGRSKNTVRKVSAMKPPLGEDAHKVASILLEAVTPKDGYTSEHASQVARLSQLVGVELGLNLEEIETLVLGALLHDLGKLVVSDAILEKPGPLTEEEWAVVKRHSDVGARTIEVLSGAVPVVRHHHERYDGTGYPDGLEGEQIPLAARIVSAVAAHDVMIRGRPYQQRRTQAEALEELSREVGHQFDKRVVEELILVRETEQPSR
jgi:HD-GYP domain-containing protein (c-di-GMP phosphodiesterase class II)